jgi:hypothetical protein
MVDKNCFKKWVQHIISKLFRKKQNGQKLFRLGPKIGRKKIELAGPYILTRKK